MKRLASTIPVLLIAASAAAQEAGEARKFEVPYTWSSADVEIHDAGAGWKVSIGTTDLVLTGQSGTPFDKLVGRCLVLSHFRLDDANQYRSVGDCLLTDADGDRIFETIEETNGAGKATMKDGTGKFEGIVADLAFSGTWQGASAEDRNAGVGLKTGTWRKAGS